MGYQKGAENGRIIAMKETVQQRLYQINQAFYEQFAGAFAATRYGMQPGWDRIIPHFPTPCQVLDLGCGNGRFAHFLDKHALRVQYTGVDGCQALIAIAQARAADLPHISVRFHTFDLARTGWERPFQHQFHVVVALAVLHHIPGEAARAAFLQAARSCLTPGGILVLSNWRFTHNARMRRKIVPWDTVGLRPQDVDADDYLLDWKAGGQTGYRYAHQIDAAEIQALAQAAGCVVIEQFQADGREGDLSLYSLLRLLPTE